MTLLDTAQTTPVNRGFRAYGARHLDQLTARAGLSPAERLAVRAVAEVLPFRTNNYVVDELIDWSAAPDDPIYRLMFPQKDMLPEEDVAHIAGLLRRDAPPQEVQRAAHRVRVRLNPHPAGQMQLNRPVLDGHVLEGVQHKYRETVLFFPARDRPATPIAVTASAGRSSSANPACGWPPTAASRSSSTTCSPIPRSPTC